MNLLMVNMAINIADEGSRSLIECCGVQILSKSGALLWYEVDPSDSCVGSGIKEAVKYLTLRGKLRVRPGHPNHVKVRP